MPKTIKELPEHGRPREKMRDRSAAALTDEELVSAIIGVGTAGVDVRTMSRKVVALIREYREALTLDHLRSVPGMAAEGILALRSQGYDWAVDQFWWAVPVGTMNPIEGFWNSEMIE